MIASCKREPASSVEPRPTTPVAIGVTYAGPASPALEASALAPIETALRGLPGVRSIRSVARTGRAVFIAELASADALPGVQRLAAQLPARIAPLTGAPTVVRGDPEARPVMWLDLQGQAPLAARSRMLAGPIAEELGRVPGVLNVDARNVITGAVIVRLDPARLDALGVTLEQLAQALAAPVTDAAALATLPVAHRNGAAIQLREVATVEDGVQPQPPPASPPRLGVRVQPGVDAAQVTTAIRTAVRSLAHTLPAGWALVEVPGPPDARRHRIAIAVRGPAWARVVELADHLAQTMRAHPALVTDVASTYVADAITLDHRVDAGAAGRYGLMTPRLTGALAAVFGAAGRLADGTPVLLRVGEHDRITPDDLAVLRLDAGDARVPLSAIIALSQRAEPTITRRDGDDVIDVLAEPADDQRSGAAAAAVIQLAGTPPAGYRIEAVPTSQ